MKLGLSLLEKTTTTDIHVCLSWNAIQLLWMTASMLKYDKLENLMILIEFENSKQNKTSQKFWNVWTSKSWLIKGIIWQMDTLTLKESRSVGLPASIMFKTRPWASLMCVVVGVLSLLRYWTLAESSFRSELTVRLLPAKCLPATRSY